MSRSSSWKLILKDSFRCLSVLDRQMLVFDWLWQPNWTINIILRALPGIRRVSDSRELTLERYDFNFWPMCCDLWAFISIREKIWCASDDLPCTCTCDLACNHKRAPSSWKTHPSGPVSETYRLQPTGDYELYWRNEKDHARGWLQKTKATGWSTSE